MAKNEIKKQILQELIKETERNIARGEIEERFAQRKVLGNENKGKWQQYLGQVQQGLNEAKERLELYEDNIKEL